MHGGRPARGAEAASSSCRDPNQDMDDANSNSGFKIQLQAMLIDTSFNSVPTVLANVFQSLHEAAVRCAEYARSLAKTRPVRSKLLISTCHCPKAWSFLDMTCLRCLHAGCSSCLRAAWACRSASPIRSPHAPPWAHQSSIPHMDDTRLTTDDDCGLTGRTGTIEGIVALAFVMLQRRSRVKTAQNAEKVRSAISRSQVQW